MSSESSFCVYKSKNPLDCNCSACVLDSVRTIYPVTHGIQKAATQHSLLVIIQLIREVAAKLRVRDFEPLMTMLAIGESGGSDIMFQRFL